MPRRDQLTYDIQQQRQRKVPWLSVLVLAAVVAGATALFAWTITSAPSPEAAHQPAPTTIPSTTPSAVTSSPTPSGSDAGEQPVVPAGSEQAAGRFIEAWLDRNPKTREPALEQVCTPALTEALMLTDPANIPRAAPRGGPVLDDASTYSVQFAQALDTGMTIRVYLVADPEARYRWLVTSVEQA